MATLSPVELSDEVCDRVDAAARHLCNSHLAPHPDQKKKALANLAESMLWFWKNCLRLDGKMDLRGQSKQYKFIVKLIREKAGEPGSPLEMPTSVAHRVGELIFNEVISVDSAVFVVGEGEGGLDDGGDFAWAGGDVLQGAPALGEECEAAFTSCS